MLELGFLLAYRSGWRISMTALASQSVTVMLPIPVGLFVFNERVSGRNLIGMAVCLTGLILMSLR